MSKLHLPAQQARAWGLRALHLHAAGHDWSNQCMTRLSKAPIPAAAAWTQLLTALMQHLDQPAETVSPAQPQQEAINKPLCLPDLFRSLARISSRSSAWCTRRSRSAVMSRTRRWCRLLGQKRQ